MFYAEDFLIGKEPTEHEKCCHVKVSVRHIGIPKHWYVLFVCVLSSVSLGGGSRSPFMSTLRCTGTGRLYTKSTHYITQSNTIVSTCKQSPGLSLPRRSRVHLPSSTQPTFLSVEISGLEFGETRAGPPVYRW